MATRSTIAYCDEESGKVYQIYCHWDGYPDHNGKILLEHYNSIDKIKDLIALGSLSILGESLGEKQDFNNHRDGMCLAYHRDRGEDISINEFINISDYALSKRAKEEFNYIYTNGQWHMFTGNFNLKYLLKSLDNK